MNQSASDHCKNSQSYDGLDFGYFTNPVCIVFSLSNWNDSRVSGLAYSPQVVLNYKSPIVGSGVYYGLANSGVFPTYIHYAILQVS